MSKSFRSCLGLTLVELLITMSVLAILVTLAAPSMTTIVNKSKVRSHARDFHSAVSFARAQAVSRARSVTICPSSDEDTCESSPANWNSGWIIFVEQGEVDGVREASSEEEQILRSYSYAGSNSLSVFDPALQTSLPSLTWDYRGFSSRPNFTDTARALAVVCDRNLTPVNALGLMISSSGRVALTKNLDSDLAHESRFEQGDGGVSTNVELDCS